MKVTLRYYVTISSALLIVLCAVGGSFLDRVNHEKMSVAHEEAIQLVNNDGQVTGERSRIERVS